MVIENSLANVVGNCVIVDKNERDYEDHSKKAIPMSADFDTAIELEIERIVVAVGCNCFSSVHHRQQL